MTPTCDLRHLEPDGTTWACARPAQHDGDCQSPAVVAAIARWQEALPAHLRMVDRMFGDPPEDPEDVPLTLPWSPTEARALAEIRAILGCAEGEEVDAVRRMVADAHRWRAEGADYWRERSNADYDDPTGQLRRKG